MKKLKWNWGTGIVLFIIGFVLLNMVFGFIALNTKVDLVRTDYYESELKYQDVINKKKAFRDLEVKPKLIRSEGTVTFQFPGNTKNLTGKIHFYRPSDANLDRKFTFRLDAVESITLQTGVLLKGFWKADIEFTDGGNTYLMQEEFYTGG